MACRNLCDKLYSTKIIPQGESVIPQKYREMMALAAAAALKCPYCQTFHSESAKMYGASEVELNELAAVAVQTSFWSAILHIQNYDMNTFMKELEAMDEYICQRRSNMMGVIE